MRYLRFARIAWLVPFIVAVNASAIPQPHRTSAIQSSIEMNDWLFDRPPSTSQDLGLQHERQSRQQETSAVHTPDLPFPLFSSRFSLWLAPDLVTTGLCLFFPRKLSPPSSQDDPFVS